MNAHRTNWLVNTCLLGLLPAIARVFVWIIYTGSVDPVSTSDFVAFGLVLHSANINEVNRVSGTDDPWRITHNGLSVIFIVIYAIIMFSTIIPSNQINKSSALSSSIILSIVSFIMSGTIFFRSRLAADGAI